MVRNQTQNAMTEFKIFRKENQRDEEQIKWLLEARGPGGLTTERQSWDDATVLDTGRGGGTLSALPELITMQQQSAFDSA